MTFCFKLGACTGQTNRRMCTTCIITHWASHRTEGQTDEWTDEQDLCYSLLGRPYDRKTDKQMDKKTKRVLWPIRMAAD